MISLCDFVMFPDLILHFDISKKASLNAISEATRANEEIFLVAKKDASKESFDENNFYSVGTIVKVREILKQGKDFMRILVEGI